MELIPIYRGRTIFAEMLRQELEERGIAAILRPVEPFMGVIGEVAQPPYSLVLVAREDVERRPEVIRECLDLTGPGERGPLPRAPGE